MSFSFSTEVFKGISDKQIFEIFCRLNMNGVALNKQELRNGTYFGLFKQTSYGLAFDYLELWRQNSIFSEQSLARMLEVELTSELLIAAIAGMQDKKKSIDSFYGQFEESYPGQSKDEKRFRETMSAISEALNGKLSESEFRRPPLFYSLYCVVYHHLFGLPEVQRKSPRRRLTADDRESLREAVARLSDMVARSKDATDTVPTKYAKFVAACQRQTDNIIPRKARFDSLFSEAF
jgi:hypothetical protein